MAFNPSHLYLRLNMLLFGEGKPSSEDMMAEVEETRQKPEIQISRKKRFLW